MLKFGKYICNIHCFSRADIKGYMIDSDQRPDSSRRPLLKIGVRVGRLDNKLDVDLTYIYVILQCQPRRQSNFIIHLKEHLLGFNKMLPVYNIM